METVLKILDPNKIRFTRLESGALKVDCGDGTTEDDVFCASMLPLSNPEHFISVAREEHGNLHQVGIIRTLKQLPSDQQRIVTEDLKFRYFLPEIIKIRKITRRYGMLEWDVETDRGETMIFVEEKRENMTFNEHGMLIITDVNKCRYRISNHAELDPYSHTQLDPHLP
jgi:hypothetical protein